MPTLSLICGLLPVPVDTHRLHSCTIWETLTSLVIIYSSSTSPVAALGSFDNCCMYSISKEQIISAIKLFLLRVRKSVSLQSAEYIRASASIGMQLIWQPDAVRKYNFWVQILFNRIDTSKRQGQPWSYFRFLKSHPIWVLLFLPIHCQPSLGGRGAWVLLGACMHEKSMNHISVKKFYAKQEEGLQRFLKARFQKWQE